MQDAIVEKNQESAMNNFLMQAAKKYKKIDEDGHYSSSVSSDFDQDEYLKQLNIMDNTKANDSGIFAR